MRRIVNILIILTIFSFVFYTLNRLVSPKYVDDLIEGSMIASYYESKKDHDVIFIGDCEVYASFSPMVMYEQTGLKSFVRGSSQQLIWQSYYILKETLKYEKPKVIVLNVNSLRYDRETSGKVNEAYNRLMIDQMKWSKEKINLINVSMDKEESFISYVFPIIRYHSRINELTSEDFKYLFKKETKTFNGFIVNNDIVPLDNLPTIRDLNNYDFSKENLEYLDKILELCKENNIELALVKVPSLYPYWYNEYDEFFVEYAKENHINYYNLYDKVDIDYSVDTYDGGLHLNLSGATKLSKYFSEVLVKDYNIKTNKNDKVYDKLLKEYNNYIDTKNKM